MFTHLPQNVINIVLGTHSMVARPAFTNTIMLMGAQEVVGSFFISLDSLKYFIKCPNISDEGLLGNFFSFLL